MAVESGEARVQASDGSSLVVLSNGEVGWLMYLRRDGDAGFSSRNPTYSGPPDLTVEFVLSNGQRDDFPASWCLPLPVLSQAVEYFSREEQRPPFIHWHDDSLQPYDRVCVVKLCNAPETYDGWAVNQRPPAVGDVGTLLDVLDEPGRPARYVVECARGDGTSLWLAEFDEGEVEAVLDSSPGSRARAP